MRRHPYNASMNAKDPKKPGPKKHDDSPRKPPENVKQSEAIAKSSDDKNPEPDKARDRQPKAKDADKAKRASRQAEGE